MRLGQDVKRGRCDECKRRKKRCVGDGPVCEFCEKKGLQCLNHDELRIKQFEAPAMKKRKSDSKSPFNYVAAPMATGAVFHQEVFQPPQPQMVHFEQNDLTQYVPTPPQSIPRKSEEVVQIESPSSPKEKITPSSLVEMIKANLPFGTELTTPDSLAFDKTPKIYLPQRKLVSSNSNEPPIIDDEIDVRVFSQESVIPKEFSLLDFLLSSTRVDFVDLSTCHLEEPISFAEIEKFLKVNQTKKTMETLKEKGYLVASKTSNLRETPLSPSTPDSSLGDTVKPVFRSLEEVNFTIDLENLKSHYFIQQSAVKQEVETEYKKFANLPDFIDRSFADELFQKFCTVSQEINYSNSFDLSSIPAFYSTDTKQEYVKVNFLKICFPLIFGNVTVLKCILVISFYRWRNLEPANEYLLKKEKCIRDLHLEVLEELQGRLTNCFSICCDHSLFCVILLLSTEVVNGLRTSLWRKLMKLTRDMIVLRGGVPKVSETLTGLCLLKLLTIHLSVGGLFSFDASELDNSANSISLADFYYIIDTHHQIDFFDNINYYSRLGLNDMKEVVRRYGHITQLYNLSTISYAANDRKGPETALSMSYNSISLKNLELVLAESESIEQQVKEFSKTPYANFSTHLNTTQMIFTQKAALLYLYQLVYKQTSTSPKTILAIQDILKLAMDLFETLQNLSFEEAQGSVIFIMPFFLVGVDLISNHSRKWYKEEMLKVFESTRKRPLLTCVNLLEEVWRLNGNGLVYVDWKDLSQKLGMDICLCA